MRRILAVVAAALGLLASAGQATAAPGDSALELRQQRKLPPAPRQRARNPAPRRVNRRTRTSPFASSALATTATSRSRTPSARTRRRETRTSPASRRTRRRAARATARAARRPWARRLIRARPRPRCRTPAVRREQHEHPRQGSEPRRQRQRLADEQRRVRRDGCEWERHGTVRRASSGGRLRHAGSRAGGGLEAARRRSLGSRAEGRGEHEHLRAGAQPRKRRQRDAVEHRRLEGDGRQHQPDRAERRAGGRLGRDPGHRPGC